MDSLRIHPAKRSDLPDIGQLLESTALPASGVESHLSNFVVGKLELAITCMGGYEQFGSNALVRSVAVASSFRNLGYASRICDALEAEARKNGVIHFYLLTETAQKFFAHRGYAEIPRSEAPNQIRHTDQFSSLCPASAALMYRAA